MLASFPTSLKSHAYGALEYINCYIRVQPEKQNPFRVFEQRDWLQGIGYVSNGKDPEATKGQWHNPEISNSKKTTPTKTRGKRYDRYPDLENLTNKTFFPLIFLTRPELGWGEWRAKNAKFKEACSGWGKCTTLKVSASLNLVLWVLQ